ncbi:DUF1192 domain-containing protein [Neorhizobium alkalisoli]|jgi:uncharacterized small protein (DUF1192 family)|uniref:Uncharacterized small protein (DUF1192 family) n=1 Tax=Neorhizobium alkalisoli TaxID=528178 RepID=A0A561QXH7_9HYPH|nr:DUF1192 domain-containing protein [Neorhizobium alkalisoli]TWF55043.1 uncharacterized small protein (DUF1192 family) [Neorhizobium alkalisoli]
MTFLDDDRPKKPVAHEIGADLSALSVDELDSRIGLMKAEIERLEAEKSRKDAGRRAADSLFRL